MKQLPPEEALSELRRHESAGHHVDERVRREVNSPGQIFTMARSTADEFLNLIWQETDEARLLTPRDEPRTLRDVGKPIVDSGHSFESLALDMGLPRTHHHPEWFLRCVAIDRNFDLDQFGWIVLTP